MTTQNTFCIWNTNRLAEQPQQFPRLPQRSYRLMMLHELKSRLNLRVLDKNTKCVFCWSSHLGNRNARVLIPSRLSTLSSLETRFLLIRAPSEHLFCFECVCASRSIWIGFQKNQDNPHFARAKRGLSRGFAATTDLSSAIDRARLVDIFRI